MTTLILAIVAVTVWYTGFVWLVTTNWWRSIGSNQCPWYRPCWEILAVAALWPLWAIHILVRWAIRKAVRP
jgi:hypothetical protein